MESLERRIKRTVANEKRALATLRLGSQGTMGWMGEAGQWHVYERSTLVITASGEEETNDEVSRHRRPVSAIAACDT